MINRKYKWGYLLIFAICIAAMAAGARYDWIITDTVYNPKSFFGVVFEAASWIPIYAFLPGWGTTMMMKNKGNMTTFAFGSILLIASCSVFAYMICDHLVAREFMRKVNPYICGIIGGFASAAIFLVMRTFKRPVIRRIQAMCGFALTYMMSYLVVIFALKVLFGRDRYEDIITGGEYVFAEWFRPVFLSSGSSFPSGHTAAAMGIVILLLLPFLFEFAKGLKLPLFIFCYAYAFLSAFSRLVMGRHFLSDTAMAIMVMTVVFIVLTPRFEKTYRRIVIKD